MGGHPPHATPLRTKSQKKLSIFLNLTLNNTECQNGDRQARGGIMEYKLDMSMMFAMHHALRRELAQVTRIAALRDDAPGPMLRAALGWELFKKFLLVHHQTEDGV